MSPVTRQNKAGMQKKANKQRNTDAGVAHGDLDDPVETPGPSSGQDDDNQNELSPDFQTPEQGIPPLDALHTRTQEKKELARLNDCLADFVEKVSQLEEENACLENQLNTYEKTVRVEVTSAQSYHEKMVTDLKQRIEEISSRDSRLQTENEGLQSANTELKKRVSTLEKALEKAKRDKISSETKLNEAIQLRDHWEEEYNTLNDELEVWKSKYGEMRKQYEEAKAKASHMDGKLLDLEKELNTKKHEYTKTIKEIEVRRRKERDEVDNISRESYEKRLRKELQVLRNLNDKKIHDAIRDAKAEYQKEISYLEQARTKGSKTIESLNDQLASMRNKCEKMSEQISRYDSNLSRLEREILREREEFTSRLKEKETEIKRLSDELRDSRINYTELLEVKVKLDNEIAAYRRMIESGEHIFHANKSPNCNYCKGRAATTGAKRRRMQNQEDELGESFIQHRERYIQKSRSEGDIEISEIDLNGLFIRLYNKSNEDVDLTGWRLEHTTDEQERVSFSFHDDSIVKAKSHITVWGSSEAEGGKPSTDQILSDGNWPTGSSISVYLYDPNDEIQARREMRNTEPNIHDLSLGEELFHTRGDRRDSCIVM